MSTDHYFFIDSTNEMVGPVSWEILQQLARAGVVVDETLAASEGSSDWAPFAELRVKEEAKSKLPPVPGSGSDGFARSPEVATAPLKGRVGSGATRAERVEASGAVRVETIRWGWALVFTAMATGISISSELYFHFGANDLGEKSAILALLLIVPSLVFGSILHYQCWHALPLEYRATTPGRAIGFLFIPIFNFYWAFVSWGKLSEGYELWQSDIHGGRIVDLKGLGVAQAVLFCASFLSLLDVPVLSMALSLTSLLILGLFYRDATSIANGLISGDYEYGVVKEEGNKPGDISIGMWLCYCGLLALVVKVLDGPMNHILIIFAPLVLILVIVAYVKRRWGSLFTAEKD